MTTTEQEILDLGRRWTAAEQAGDTAALDDVAAEGFTLVGPVGFVLDRAQWLQRYASGDLITHEIDWHDVAVHDHGDTAVATGVHTQRAAYRGRPVDGSFRSTHVAVRRDGRWRLAAIHLGPLGGPPPFAQATTEGATR